MTVEGLRTALDQGVRAIVCTPRAQNPTGASLTEARAAELRAVLREHPYVLVIEDDHFSMLSRRPFHSLIGPEHRRWALVRSVSKFLGPDMRGGVAEDAQAVGRVDRDGLDDVGLRHRRGQVLELAVDAHRDNGSISEELEAVGHCDPLPVRSKRTLQL